MRPKQRNTHRQQNEIWIVVFCQQPYLAILLHFARTAKNPPDTVVEIEFRPSEKRVWLAVSAPNCCGRDTAHRVRHGRPETDLQGSLELAVTTCVCGASQQVQNGVSLSNGA